MTEFRANINNDSNNVTVTTCIPTMEKDCNHEWHRENYVLTTYPPQYVYVCSKCGARKTVMGENVSIAYSPAEDYETLRLKLKDAEARIAELEARLKVKDVTIEKLTAHQKPLEEKIENQKVALNHFNVIFSYLNWDKDPDTGHYTYMKGSEMLKRVKRAEAKADKWKQRALEAENRVMDLSDLIEDLEEENRDLQARIFKEKLDADEALETERQEHERTKMSLVKYRHEYNKLSRQFISLYNDLCSCCDYQGKFCSVCCDCGAKERYKDICEALEQGLWISTPIERRDGR